MERVLFITGMGCEKCEAKVRAALEAVPGVSKAVVSRVAGKSGKVDELIFLALKGLGQ